MDESPTNPFRSNTQQQHEADAVAFWTALSKDTGSRVVVLDQSGNIEFINDSAGKASPLSANIEASLSATPDSPLAAPKTLFDLYPELLAEERLRILRRSLSTASGIALVGMVAGRLTRDTFRPLSSHTQGVGRVLLVSSEMMADQASDVRSGAADEYIRAVHNDAGPLSALTKREVEVLTHIGKGLSTADIAKSLHRSVKTVEWHRVSLGNKLGVSNRVELARIAIRAGLCSLSEE